jgi:hypothetical protein
LVGDPVVVLPQSVGEPSGNGRVIAFLPQGDHDKLAVLGATHVNEITTLEVANEHRAARTLLHTAGSVGARNTGRDLGLFFERPAHALTEALGRVVSHGDKHWSCARIQPPAGGSDRDVSVSITQTFG